MILFFTCVIIKLTCVTWKPPIRVTMYDSSDLYALSYCGRIQSPIVQSLNSPLFPPHIGAEPARAKRESTIPYMRMLRTPPSHPLSVKNHIFVADNNTDHDKPHFNFLLPQCQHQRKCLLFQSSSWKRHCATHWREQSGMDSYRQRPSNFWLARSDYAHVSYPGLSFCPPGSSPYMGREERRVQGLD